MRLNFRWLCAILLTYSCVASTRSVGAAYGKGNLVVSNAPQSIKPDIALNSGSWTLYTTAVNEINCVEEQGTDIWLGTDFGLKHIDHARKIVTQYTESDGLPGLRVTAVKMDAESVYCTVDCFRNGAPSAVLCRFETKTKRWTELQVAFRHTTSVAPSSDDAWSHYVIGAPVESSFIACTPERICFAAGSVEADNPALFHVYDKRLREWRSIPMNPAYAGKNRYFNLYGMVAERYALWMATNVGLLRYDLPRKTWKRFLPDQVVHSLSLGPSNTVWAVAYKPAKQATVKPGDVLLPIAPGGHWMLSRTDTRSGAIVGEPVYPSDPRFAGTDFAPGALIVTEAIVQISGVLSPSGRGHTLPSANATLICQIDRKQRQWSIVNPVDPASFHTVRSLLCKPILPQGVLLTNLYADHFPGWYWASDPFPHIVAEALASQSQTFWDDDKESVTVENGKTLVCTDLKTNKVERLAFPSFPLKKLGLVYSIAVIENELYAVMTDALYVYDLERGTWRAIQASLTNENAQNYRLIAQASNMWVGTGESVSRFSRKVDKPLTGILTRKAGELVGADADSIWAIYTQDRATIIRENPVTDATESLALTPSGEIPSGPLSKVQPIRVIGGIVWCRLIGIPSETAATGVRQCLAGYNWKTKTWTVPQWLKSEDENISLFDDGEKVLAAMNLHSGGLYSYNAAARAWREEIASQPLPVTPGKAVPLTIVSTDAREVWFYSNEETSLFVFNKSAHSWTTYPSLERGYALRGDQNCVRYKDDIYHSSWKGLSRFNIATHVWASVPGPDVFDYSIVWAGGDSDVAWTVLRTNTGGQTFAARLNRRTGVWKFFTEAEGFPVYGAPVLTLVGSEVWADDGGFVFRLDPDGMHWSDVSEKLLKASLSAPICMDITPDGKTAWFLLVAPEGAIDGAARGPRPAESLVLRYEISTGEMQTFRPDPKWNEFGGMIRTDANSVWLVTDGEQEQDNLAPSHLYMLDAITKKWRQIQVPPEFSSVPFRPKCMTRFGESLWFMSPSAVFRFKVQ